MYRLKVVLLPMGADPEESLRSQHWQVVGPKPTPNNSTISPGCAAAVGEPKGNSCRAQ